MDFHMEVILTLLAGFGLAALAFTGLITWFAWTIYRAAAPGLPGITDAARRQDAIRDPFPNDPWRADVDSAHAATPYSRQDAPGEPKTASLAPSR